MSLYKHLNIPKATFYRHLKQGLLKSLIYEYELSRTQGILEKPLSQNYLRTSIRYLDHYLKTYPVITHQSIYHYLSQHHDRACKDRHAALSGFCRFLVHKGLLSEFEYAKIQKLYPKKNPYHKPKQYIINKDLIRAISHDQEDPLNVFQVCLCIFMSETALRASEVALIEYGDLSFSETPTEATVFVRCGKGGKSRLVPFSKKAQECVRDYLKVRPSGISDRVWLYPSKTKGWIELSKDLICRVVKDYSDSKGIKFTAHSFRHYRITMWANNPKIPLITTQKWAGHSDIKVTMGYVHQTDEEAMESAFWME